MLIIPIIFLSFNVLIAQAPEIDWERSYGGSYTDEAYAMDNTPDGGYIVAGSSFSYDGDVTGHHGDHISNDLWIIKISASGDLQWQKSLGGTGYDVAYAVQSTSDGGYIVAGTADSQDGDITHNHGNTDYWVVKLSSSGEMEWQKTYGGTATDWPYSIIQTNDGGYIVGGYSTSTNGDVIGNNDGLIYSWILKLDTIGNIQWQKLLNTPGSVSSIKQTSDNGYIIAGYGYIATKLDSSGNIQWYIYEMGIRMEDVEITSDGGYLFVGDCIGGLGDVDYWIIKTDASGNIQWQKIFGGLYMDKAYSVKQRPDGSYIVAGESRSNDGDLTHNYGIEDYWILKLNPQGEILWQKSVGGSSSERQHSLQLTEDGGYIISGSSSSNDGDISGNHGYFDFWVVKLHPDGMATEDISQNAISIYPNPVKNMLYISSADSIESISVYNLLGQKIRTIQGNRQMLMYIDVSDLNKGPYIIYINTKKGTDSLKFIKT